MNRRVFLTTTALAVCGFAGVMLVGRSPSMTEFIVTPASAEEMETTDTSIVPDLVLGDPDAPVELIEYASYTCPHCASFHQSVMPELKANYIDTGKVKLVYREVYFDKFGLWASMIARCGGEMRYFGIQKMLYDEQQDWVGGGQQPMQIVENLRTIGKKAGLTDENMDACLNDADMAQAMVVKFQKEMEEFDVNATPTLIVNGTKQPNMNYNDLSKLLDEEIEKAG